MELKLVWLKSDDTNSMLSYPRTLDNVVSAALMIALFTDSTVTFVDKEHVKSTIDTFEVGTLIAIPESLPLRSGKIFSIALVAPVDVGIMLPAADRDLRKSE